MIFMKKSKKVNFFDFFLAIIFFSLYTEEDVSKRSIKSSLKTLNNVNKKSFFKKLQKKVDKRL